MRNGESMGSVVLAFALSACLTSESAEQPVHAAVGEQAAALVGETKPVRSYYTLRRDVRRCAAPLCGGFFVALANRARTTCADRTQAAECYVAEVRLPDGRTADNGSLVHGSLRLQRYPIGRSLGVLVGDAVLDPVLDGVAAAGQYELAYDTGIRCIRAPCPSLAITPLNGNGTATTNVNVTFSASDPKASDALQQAYFDELASLSELGTGAVVVGRRRVAAASGATSLAVTNVYVPQGLDAPVCLVQTEGNTTIAWNFPSAADAQDLQSGLTGNVQLLEGRCGEQQLFCTLEFNPVHGVIDALGEECHQSGNACGFRADVIIAAGLDSKASGTWTAGECPSEACTADSDCRDGFCGWAAGGGRICRPWAQEGEHCEGFVRPEDRRFCAPGLDCVLTEPTGDAGGICTAP